MEIWNLHFIQNYSHYFISLENAVIELEKLISESYNAENSNELNTAWFPLFSFSRNWNDVNWIQNVRISNDGDLWIESGECGSQIL